MEILLKSHHCIVFPVSIRQGDLKTILPSLPTPYLVLLNAMSPSPFHFCAPYAGFPKTASRFNNMVAL